MFLLGAIAAKPKLLDGLKPKDFTGAWAECVAYMQRAVKDKSSEPLNQWLDANLGIRRTNGDTTTDAALERLRQDAAFRAAAKNDEFAAQLSRLMAEMSDRRLRK